MEWKWYEFGVVVRGAGLRVVRAALSEPMLCGDEFSEVHVAPEVRNPVVGGGVGYVGKCGETVVELDWGRVVDIGDNHARGSSGKDAVLLE